jgi:imidazolonepropionase-like amidohydrolase
MGLNDMLQKTREDVQTFAQIVKAGIRINEHLLAMVAKWFSDVEIALPIAEMPMTEEERNTLSIQVAEDMISALDKAITSLDNGGAEAEVLSQAAATLDPLWRELAGLQARVLNEIHQRHSDRPTRAEVLEAIENMVEQLMQATGEDEETTRNRMRKDAGVIRLLRQLGIEPDAI